MEAVATALAAGGAGQNQGSFRRSRGVNWTEEETEQLLEAWADRDVQMLLDNGPHNRQAFERVSFNLVQRGMDKTPSQCREKIKKLKTIYRSLNTGHGKVSRKIRGRLVQKLHQVMGGVTVPMGSDKDVEQGGAGGNPDAEHHEHVAGSGAASAGPGGGTEDRMAVDFVPGYTITNPIGPTSDFLATVVSSSSSEVSSSEGDPMEQAAEHEQQHQVRSRDRSKRSRGHRRRRSRHSAVYVLIDKMIAAQATAHERFAVLEERRLLLDKELEEKRLEAEARRQEAQRQHELRLLATMAQHMANVLKSLNPLTFTGARCDAVSAPLTVAVSDPSKPHEVVTVGVSNGCAEYGHSESNVYSNM